MIVVWTRTFQVMSKDLQRFKALSADISETGLRLMADELLAGRQSPGPDPGLRRLAASASQMQSRGGSGAVPKMLPLLVGWIAAYGHESRTPDHRHREYIRFWVIRLFAVAPDH